MAPVRPPAGTDVSRSPSKIPKLANTPSRSPIRKSPMKSARKIGLTLAQKQAIMDNIQMEVTERARHLRAQYHLQAQSLRMTIELRVNRIPMAYRKLTMAELIRRAENKQGCKSDKPPPVPEKDHPPQKLNTIKIPKAPSSFSSRNGGGMRQHAPPPISTAGLTSRNLAAQGGIVIPSSAVSVSAPVFVPPAPLTAASATTPPGLPPPPALVMPPTIMPVTEASVQLPRKISGESNSTASSYTTSATSATSVSAISSARCGIGAGTGADVTKKSATLRSSIVIAVPPQPKRTFMGSIRKGVAAVTHGGVGGSRKAATAAAASATVVAHNTTTSSSTSKKMTKAAAAKAKPAVTIGGRTLRSKKT